MPEFHVYNQEDCLEQQVDMSTHLLVYDTNISKLKIQLLVFLHAFPIHLIKRWFAIDYYVRATQKIDVVFGALKSCSASEIHLFLRPFSSQKTTVIHKGQRFCPLPSFLIT
jgi:hypothetical protein